MTSIKGMSMNANGCVPKDLNRKWKISSKRNYIRQDIISTYEPDLIFLQDSDILLRNICTWDFSPKNYQSVGDKAAGILFDTSTFTLCMDEDPKANIRRLYEFITIGKKNDLNSEILSRMEAVILQTKGPSKKKFLCISFHGQNKLKNEKKIKIFKDFKSLITRYSSNKNIPVVIGGDFNLDLSMLSQQEFTELLLIDYSKLEHRHKKIDYVLTSAAVASRKHSCEPIDVLRVYRKQFS
ncbi:unnamed protein product [Mytilus coruscus]|uniref:Endonuclease/exonuclease/phosphatase domain-containing protein n=1 Tax=Mytilus coruscus TaxID=42192 RepID=A0A6J8EX49_MYTCO|nr:unnamed protein product [Mytilus coruscus]